MILWNLIKQFPSLDDHGHLYMYYGIPYAEECYIYGDEEDQNLILSYECDDLCTHIADQFQDEFKWIDVLDGNRIKLEEIFEVDVETQDIDVISSLQTLYLVESITEDKFIEALNNVYLIRLIKRLASWN